MLDCTVVIMDVLSVGDSLILWVLGIPELHTSCVTVDGKVQSLGTS